MRNGIPPGAAFGMSDEQVRTWRLSREERAAFAIVFSEFEGNQFDFERMRFVDPDRA